MEATAPLAAALAHADRLLGAQPALAARQAEEILRAVPLHPQALLILGSAKRRLGDVAAARAILENLARVEPVSALTAQEHGLTLAALGEDKAALAELRRAVALRPLLTGAWRAIGDLLTLAGDTEGADAAYAHHIRTAISDPRLMAAGAALCEGRLSEAEHLLRAHLRAAPTDVAALRMLAETGTRLGRFAAAENLLLRCLELAPGFAAARHNLAIVLHRQNRPAKAIPHLRLLLADDPRNAGYLNLLGACLATVGENEGAIEAFESVLRRHRDQPTIWLNYGHTLKTVGRRDDAIGAYRTCVSQNPGFGEAWWSLANMKTLRFGDADIAAIEAQLARTELGLEDRFHLHYALGHALELRAAYADSFRHYAEGARLRRSELRYSAADTTAQLARARAVFTSAFFAARAGAGCADPAPIFVVGLPRAGSTLIEQMLASHPLVEGTMELPELPSIVQTLRDGAEEGDYFATVAALDPAALAALGEEYIARTRAYRKTDKPFFIDKLPNNFVHAGLIHLILPRAKIIDARRHPMATCFSAFKQHFARGQHYTYDLRELGLYYRDYVALMAHFDAVLPGRVHCVEHERLVDDPEAELRRLLAACGLNFAPACLRFWETPRAVRTASSEQVRRPLSREGLHQWRHYEEWLGPLKEALGLL